ncbi:MAG TPA: glutathione peroxidase [Clostridiales bacterium]|jgi:glutathione peroxidase|nr:glutathione peroxidase [Clostridiales bacterium]
MNVYDFTVKDRMGNEVSLSEYQGDVLLIVNSATQCGFTPQYDDLEDLYEKYVDEGFIILDFPCNQFGNQAPGTDDEIYSFCESNYGVKFPVFSKIDVKGENAHPLYKYLISQKGFAGFDEDHELTPVLHKMLSEENPDYQNDPNIKWNFTKFLIDRNGNVVDRFEPTEEIYIIEDRIKELL